MSATVASVVALVTALLAAVPPILKTFADRKRGIKEVEVQEAKQSTQQWQAMIASQELIIDSYKEENERLRKVLKEYENK